MQQPPDEVATLAQRHATLDNLLAGYTQGEILSAVARANPTPPDIIDMAVEQYAYGSDDDVEIDSNALSSTGEGGTWVLAWVWVAHDTDEDDDEDSDEDGESGMLNSYRCQSCGHEWQDEWGCAADDDCPSCGARHMSPYKSEEV